MRAAIADEPETDTFALQCGRQRSGKSHRRSVEPFMSERCGHQVKDGLNTFANLVFSRHRFP